MAMGSQLHISPFSQASLRPYQKLSVAPFVSARPVGPRTVLDERSLRRSEERLQSDEGKILGFKKKKEGLYTL